MAVEMIAQGKNFIPPASAFKRVFQEGNLKRALQLQRHYMQTELQNLWVNSVASYTSCLNTSGMTWHNA